ncbi:unnamed protein product [Ceratitis capitata]|uniref:(Mediterranean fruit fly) hypothetical protein n=1 Tax=Ceratitis capitata TaxID=7213 RepID=A0A811VDJ6_CERCA|nr:unnamed protein product [Ceratitis capitata]
MHLNICTIVVHTQRLHHHYDHQHRALNKASDNKPNNSETTEAKTAATTNNQQQRTAAATTKVKQKVKQSICKIHMTTVRKWRRTAEPSHTPTTQRRRDAASELLTSWLALAAGRKLRELVTTSAVLTEALLVYSDVFVKGSDLCQLLMSSVGVMCQRLN